LFRTFLGPKGTRFAHSHLRAQKSHEPLQMALEMDLPSCILYSVLCNLYSVCFELCKW
jgi:hypothetical protein